MEIAWLCARFYTPGVAEIAESTNLKGCPHAFVYIVYVSRLLVDSVPFSQRREGERRDVESGERQSHHYSRPTD